MNTKLKRPLLALLALAAVATATVAATGARPATAKSQNQSPAPPAVAVHDHTTHTHATAFAQGTAQGDGIRPLRGNLGNHRHPITTNAELAQRYFDEGLALTYGFNHAEAIRSFQAALTLDPACAMCYWGIAYALGPNINAPMDPAAVPEAYAALQMAQAVAPGAGRPEQAYINALAARYAPTAESDRAALDLAYADAMRELSRRYPDDLDAATLFAEALMDLTPWNYFTKDGQPTTYTDEIVTALESVLARNPLHPGANHFYIHAVEASYTPQRAVPSAERLETLVPGAGHLVHMPAHIYWRVGRYHDAARINEHAIHVDQTTVIGGAADQGSHSFYALSYYPHNIHFLLAAAQMEGRSAVAIATADKLIASIPEDAYQAAPGLEDWRPMPLFTLVRFGRWDEILRQPQPAASFQYTTGIWHWARGLAYVRMGQLERAGREHDALKEIAASEAMQKLELPSFGTAASRLEIASHILGGELLGGSGRHEDMIAELEQAVAIQDDMAYIEPPAWFYPARHNLGAALLDAGRTAEAEAVYREDLRQYPENGWSLFGLAKSLRAQGKAAEANEAQRRFEAVWRNADVTLTASRF